MLSAVNEADYLRTPTCCRCCEEKKPRCVCQACHDGFHRCPHQPHPMVDRRKPEMEKETSYVAHYCVERPFRPPPKSFKPLFDNLYLCGPADDTTTYKGHFQPPRQGKEQVSCRHPKVDYECEFAKKTVYMIDYGAPMTEQQQAHENWMEWRQHMYRQWLDEQKQLNAASHPKRPPRPYDYSKEDRYTTGELYIPKKMMEASREQMELTLPKYRSDGAVNSYTTGTTMKDTFRADVDIHNMFCCRPETHYQPDKLQTCIVCHSAAGKPHAVCPQVLYQRPEKPLVDPPYRGPRPAVKECSLYNWSYSPPDEKSFLIPAPPCARQPPCQPSQPCSQLARNVPIAVGYERCS